MGLRRELLTMFVGVILLNLVLAFGAIGLLARMGPAIERISERNVTSIVAAIELLEVLAQTGEGQPPVEHARLQASLRTAGRSVTEPGEQVILDAIATDISKLAAGAPRAELVQKIHALAHMNVAAMTRADAEARRLGWAGGWAAALIGFLSLLLSLGMLSRLRRRVVDPLEELDQVFAAAKQGDFQRRCRTHSAPTEVQTVMRDLNDLMDDYHLLAHGPPLKAQHELEGYALHELMEREPRALALVAVDGTLTRTNSPMLDALASEKGERVRQALANIELASKDGLEVVPLPDDSGSLCYVNASSR